MRDIVLFDLDGTIGLIQHRVHHISGKRRNWPAFFAACGDDLPNVPVIETLHTHAARHRIWIASGRSDEVRAETEAWLDLYVGMQHIDTLLMRRAGDRQADDRLKRGWLHNGSIPRERVLCVYDDRQRVVDMWRSEGLACFQVAPGDF
ncbi:hypothetical protein [Caballeronia sp. AZ10_KS36]|uniref:phosphatase domain-containing protein n=1 Tax=Caballeronia sp. AZ10_KS36 TaxID=2921757 RepID=UPI002028D05D|nr:hypothetical protein [Caballeronia sp. AZ10_KS36]